MSTTQQKIKELEDEYARTQKNKATSFHLGQIKAKLAKLRRELIEGPKGGAGGGTGEGFDVKRTGDARIGFVGFPSVGKSTLMSKLTGTFSLAADYEFTTVTTVPGVLFYEGAKLQMLDLPGIIEGAHDGKGRGRQVIGVARTTNLIYIVLDCTRTLEHKKIIEDELFKFGIRLNQEPPPIVFTKTDRGGINFSYTVDQSHLDEDLVRAICQVYRVNSADVRAHCDATEDQLIDVIEGNRVYIPCLYVLNKIDCLTIEELDLLYELPNVVPISAGHMWNIDTLLAETWKRLDFIRVYTKPKGQIPDFEEPVVLRRKKRTVKDFCNAIHKAILPQFKNAMVWGASARFNPQIVGKDHVLEDEDVVQIIKK